MVQGAILGASSILVRIIGLIYRVPLNNILGEKGVAYYGAAYDVYSILLLLSSYSIPLAVSKMVSARMATGQYRNARKVLRYAITFSLMLGLVAFLITFFGADLFAKLYYPEVAVALRVLAPALIIMSVLGVLRGFFQGLGTMVPTALSNIFEQIVNAVVSIVAASVLFKSASTAIEAGQGGPNIAEARGAAGGTLGTVMGALTALLFMVYMILAFRKRLNRMARKDRHPDEAGMSSILKILILTILPVILSTTIYNVSTLLDGVVFVRLMGVKGFDPNDVAVLHGMYTGQYRLIINVPIALASALASSLIPSVVASMAQKSRGMVIRKIDSAIKLTMMIAFPCTVGIGVLAKPIITLLFRRSVDPDKAALMLMIGCISIALYSLSTITNSILQGIDRMSVPVKHSAIAIVVHLAFLAGLLMVTGINIFGVVISDMLFAFIVCFLNHRSLKRYINYQQEVKKTFILPAICSVIMGIVTFVVYRVIFGLIHSNLVGVIIAVIFAVVVYGIALLLLGVVDEEELEMIPMGGRIAWVAKKLHLLR